jgi:hypothetical protein
MPVAVIHKNSYGRLEQLRQPLFNTWRPTLKQVILL